MLYDCYIDFFMVIFSDYYFPIAQNGVKKLWDFGISRKSVCIIIFNVTRKKVIMVKQLRPAVLFAELREKYTECLDKDHEKVNSFMKGMAFYRKTLVRWFHVKIAKFVIFDRKRKWI